MNISLITSSYYSQKSSETSLTEEQKTTLEEILAKYDSENLTEEDRQALQSELKEAGIPRCQESAKMLRQAGLLPDRSEEETRNLESVLNGGRGSNKLTDLIERFKSGEITQDQFMSTIQQYAESGMLTPGNLIDELA